RLHRGRGREGVLLSPHRPGLEHQFRFAGWRRACQLRDRTEPERSASQPHQAGLTQGSFGLFSPPRRAMLGRVTTRTSRHFALEPLGDYSLRESAGFVDAWHEAPSEGGKSDGHLHLAFLTDNDWTPAGVCLTQDA